MNGAHYKPELLAAVRKEKITQKELAERLGVTEMTIHRAETGKNASYELLSDICREIGLDIKTILLSTETKIFCASN
jgi:transcriptional regulator with XRE-family HTH domain